MDMQVMHVWAVRRRLKCVVCLLQSVSLSHNMDLSLLR